MATAHPMLPDATHDEFAEQCFVRDLKVYLTEQIEPFHRKVAEVRDPGSQSNARVEAVYEALHAEPAFRAWASLRRTSQDMLWHAVGASVARQSEVLAGKAAVAEPKGSVKLDPHFVAPAYLADRDVHLMPGGYALDDAGIDQGAIMDRGGAVYMLGRNGGQMNDVRGHTVLSHLFARFPNFEPTRILELGCGIGASAVPVALAFPDAEVHAIDVGASVLRYAHARAEHLGAVIHFSQDDAEHTRFADASFDLVFSCVLMHETSEAAMSQIIAESLRLLRPGGVAIHLEVPQRYAELDLWGRIRGQIEMDYNNEPAWKAAISVDFDALMRAAGFADVEIGFQDATSTPMRGEGGFSDRSRGVFRSWFVASGRRF
ncbi:Methyltransferase domain-containing protein [Sphingomonas sp. YR710]|uniref:class I SAM-dependent methyltransferase n=1 Tax=Sphingomonas sp. YR710 TaxID=1882773 RepID=UPI00088AF90C|nr:class I SAM-dependent methyltransferase [Sphingomonas sp. YR710]SDC82780.1 Methyltransferase domain-containing protein [Sphingomonas sp. YR710]